MNEQTPIAYVDCETTSLINPWWPHGRRPWEIAIIREDPGEQAHTLHVFVDDVDLTYADRFSLNVGRFYQRHPLWTDDPEALKGNRASSEALIVRRVAKLLQGCHLVGAVPSFDDETFAAMLGRYGFPRTWNYHLIDVENLIAGHLGLEPPYDSEELSRKVDIDPNDFDRHTALGDAQWARAMYRRVVAS